MIFNNIYPPDIPDSDLDPDLTTEKVYECMNYSIKIACGDWVDVHEGAIGLDAMWGMSYQVCNTYENNLIGILASQDGGDTYSETVLSTQNILNNYRRMPQE
ncbi:MAG: hypothetical protein IPQ08_05890 [Chitinophagaceae bacterium]|nr:hypothetical protein [Chitinophagaceae bacterium]